MNSSRRRPRPFGPSAPALLGVVGVLGALAGCTSVDGPVTVAVPSPGAKAAGLCRDLHAALPERVDGLDRVDPAPASELTSAWGDPAIILRCGVPRPVRMNDPEADGVDVNGVGWLLEEQDDGSFRFTTALRLAYVEVTLPKSLKDRGMGPLTDFAGPITATVPEGIAD
ncbi:DUF3515 domain-containing protein [Streptomyces sp. LE64]|uniref:DUF3515 domain-containing protein n=1 Tax=Streptomyces sp. LE64 TaxID=3448653 RepID=UPI004042B8F0